MTNNISSWATSTTLSVKNKLTAAGFYRTSPGRSDIVNWGTFHQLLHLCCPTRALTPQGLSVEEFPPPKEPGPRTQTQKPTSWCGAVGRSDKSIWGKLSVRNFRSNCLGQNWLLGRANPAAWGWGTMGANVLMCGRWLGRDNGRIS